jgi:uncharacterized membrane protein
MEPESLESFLQAVGRETWELFQKHALVLILAGVIMLLLSAVSLGLLAGPLGVGFLDLVQRARRGESVQTGAIFERFDSFVASLIAFIVIGIAVTIGMFLLVVPGLVVLIFSTFTLHAIAYERLGAIGAIKRSVQLVRTNFVNVLVLMLVISLAQTIGGAVLLGTLLTLPLGLVASALAFQRIASTQPRPLASGPGVSVV